MIRIIIDFNLIVKFHVQGSSTYFEYYIDFLCGCENKLTRLICYIHSDSK